MTPSEKSSSQYKILALLALLYFLHAVDRQIIAVVLEPVKHEFHINDKRLGLLGGLGYAIMFALACVPTGWLIDRVSRVRLLAALLSVWSGLTVVCGFASTFSTLLIARMAVGAAEAGGAPAIMSLISDFFIAQKRSIAIELCYFALVAGVSAIVAVPLGITLALAATKAVAIASLWTMAFFNGVWSGPAFGLAMSIAAPRVRGVVASFLQLFVNLIGAGTLSDFLSGGLRIALALCFTANIWAATHYFLAAKAVRQETAAA
jgi:MFS family permease